MKKLGMFFICSILYAQVNAQKRSEPFTLQQLQSRFYNEKYADAILIGFQQSMRDLREKPQLNEDIPGEVLSWYTLNGRYSMHKTFIITKEELNEVATIPNDELFLKTLNSFVPEKSRFIYGSDLWSLAFVKQKLEDNYYLITATTKSYNSHPDIPNDDILIFDLEYKTKDFKEFQLVRLKDSHTETWIEVKK